MLKRLLVFSAISARGESFLSQTPLWAFMPARSSSLPQYMRVSSITRAYGAPASSFGTTSTVVVRDADGLERLGELLAGLLCRGDVVLLHGDLGAGKTTLSRGLVRAKLNDPEMAVTSPSYLLDNTYNYGVLTSSSSTVDGSEDEGMEVGTIHHMDLYRLPAHAFDGGMLGIPGIYSSCLCLLEWPERLKDSDLPASYLDVDITIQKDEARVVVFRPCGGWGSVSGQAAAMAARLEDGDPW